jgi:hypothetical protein
VQTAQSFTPVPTSLALGSSHRLNLDSLPSAGGPSDLTKSHLQSHRLRGLHIGDHQPREITSALCAWKRRCPLWKAAPSRPPPPLLCLRSNVWLSELEMPGKKQAGSPSCRCKAAAVYPSGSTAVHSEWLPQRRTAPSRNTHLADAVFAWLTN